MVNRLLIFFAVIVLVSCEETIDPEPKLKYEVDLIKIPESIQYVVFDEEKDSIPILDDENPFHYYNQDGMHVSLDVSEIRNIELHVQRFMNVNEQIDWASFDEYRFQYIPGYNRLNQKLVWVNGNCRDELSSWLKFIEDWNDGGACHFNWVYNLATKEIQYLNINGK